MTGNRNADENAAALSKKSVAKLPAAITEYFFPTGIMHTHACAADEAAQRAQMQALCCASAGTDSNNAASNTAVTHQHGGCGIPVSRSISLAHWLG